MSVLDLTAGYRGVPGGLTAAEARALQRAVRTCTAGCVVVVVDPGHGRAVAAAAEVLPYGVELLAVGPPDLLLHKVTLYWGMKARVFARYLEPGEGAALYAGPKVRVLHGELEASLAPWRKHLRAGALVLKAGTAP